VDIAVGPTLVLYAVIAIVVIGAILLVRRRR
jgi:hypothetical protein